MSDQVASNSIQGKPFSAPESKPPQSTSKNGRNDSRLGHALGRIDNDRALDDGVAVSALRSLFVALVYLALAQGGNQFTIPQVSTSAFFPPSGLALALIYFRGRRAWTGIWLGALLNGILQALRTTGTHNLNLILVRTAISAAGVALQAIVGAGMLRRWAPRWECFDHFGNTLRFCLFPFVFCLIASTIGMGVVFLTGSVSWSRAFTSWYTWWIGDAVGVLVIAPVLTAWWFVRSVKWSAKEFLWFPALYAATTILALTAFIWVSTPAHPLEFIVFPFIAWAAVHYRLREVTTVILLVDFIATVSISHFATAVELRTPLFLIVMQVKVAFLSTMGLTISAIWAERKLAGVAARESESRYIAAFQTTHESISINRRNDGVFLDVNQAHLDLLGLTREQVIGHTADEVGMYTTPADRETARKSISETGECRNLELKLTKRNGEKVWILFSASPFELDGEECLLCVARDITAKKHAEEEIKNLAFYDTLTGLPNRRLVMERLEHSLHASPHSANAKALLIIDLDNFKTLNGTLGHHVGDQLLQTIARRIDDSAPDARLVARLGGDEFLVMLEDLGESLEDAASQVRRQAELILANMREPIHLNDHRVLISASIGITVVGDLGVGVADILKQADIAMYQAKAAGRNAIRFFAPELQSAVNARAEMEEEIRMGIQADQFVAYLQPQVNRGALVGVEALVRWNHPQRGLLAPGAFISIAEETGLIVPLGDRILEIACNQIAAWSHRNEASSIRVAVNVSARQFRHPDFVENTLAIIQRTGANPERLILEITESLLLDDMQDTIGKMNAIKSQGVQFALDDFGTGHSSLSYLKSLPLDQVKIDRSFIRDILEDLTSAAIARSIIYLGRALWVSVIAEGVETNEQRDFLEALGCHEFQGYLFGRPVSIEDFEQVLTTMPIAPSIERREISLN